MQPLSSPAIAAPTIYLAPSGPGVNNDLYVPALAYPVKYHGTIGIPDGTIVQYDDDDTDTEPRPETTLGTGIPFSKLVIQPTGITTTAFSDTSNPHHHAHTDAHTKVSVSVTIYKNCLL